MKNSAVGDANKETKSNKNDPSSNNHTKKASIFGNIINYIRGTPRVQQNMKKLNLKINPLEEELTDE